MIERYKDKSWGYEHGRDNIMRKSRLRGVTTTSTAASFITDA